jgi:two-component system LytT family response regulator
MIQAVLADDEVLARQKLRQLLREIPEIEVVGEGATAAETIDLVRATKPDLLYLDVRMPDMDGFDIVGELSAAGAPAMPSIIFTTAYDRYALRAFEIHAVDYLLKPFTLERFRSATQRALEQIKTGRQTPRVSSSNPRAASSSSLSPRSAGSEPKRTTSASVPSLRRICSARR